MMKNLRCLFLTAVLPLAGSGMLYGQERVGATHGTMTDNDLTMHPTPGAPRLALALATGTTIVDNDPGLAPCLHAALFYHITHNGPGLEFSVQASPLGAAAPEKPRPGGTMLLAGLGVDLPLLGSWTSWSLSAAFGVTGMVYTYSDTSSGFLLHPNNGSDLSTGFGPTLALDATTGSLGPIRPWLHAGMVFNIASPNEFKRMYSLTLGVQWGFL